MTSLYNRALPSVQRTLREVRAYVFAATRAGSADGVRTLIFAQGRTGSTLLESLMVSSGHFEKNGEILKDKGSRIVLPGTYVEGLSLRHPAENYVCHVKLYHLTRDRVRVGRRPVDPGAFLRQLSADGWRVIYLRREDKIRHAMSTFVAEARGGFHKTDSRPESTKVHIDRRHLEGLVRERIRFEEEERAALAGIDVHEVVYERDLADAAAHQRTADGVLDFLSLERRPVTTQLRKVNARPLHDTISNYDEFAQWVEELGWGHVL